MNQHNESAPHARGACANCGTTSVGAYCHACGQRIETHRLTLPHLLHEIPHAVFHVDRGFLVTIFALATRPGRTMNAYLDGHRVRYFNPLSLLMILAGLCALAYAKLRFDFTPLTAGMPAKDAANFKKVFDAVLNNYTLGLVAMLPGAAFTSWLIMGRNRNYGEHLAINAFIFAFMCAITLVTMPIHILVDGSALVGPLVLVITLLYTSYQVFALWDTFRTPGRWGGALLRAIATAFGYALLSTAVTTVVIVVVKLLADGHLGK